jgi:NTE family protein
MGCVIDGRLRRMGLALSGGGFRAAAFHLGVMRRLDSFGILDNIDLITCVSGGSIAGACLALNWTNPDRLDILDQYLRTRSIATSSVLGGLLDPFATRLEKLAQTYDKDLFRSATLGELKHCPRLYINATNLSTGNAFFFVAGGEQACEMGDHELGFVNAEEFQISHAVAASSAFPPVFPPLKLTRKEYSAADTAEYITLCDGGIYDNLGINPMLRERNALDYAIVSDGGKPFVCDPTPTEAGAIVLKVGIDIMMEQIRGLQFDRLQHHRLANRGPIPMWFSIDSIEGQSLSGDATFASSIRTNLAKLSADEMSVLTRHGASLVERRIRDYAPELL